jgi:hypothetical protein
LFRSQPIASSVFLLFQEPPFTFGIETLEIVVCSKHVHIDITRFHLVVTEPVHGSSITRALSSATDYTPGMPGVFTPASIRERLAVAKST